jgi:hypothetical protein
MTQVLALNTHDKENTMKTIRFGRALALLPLMVTVAIPATAGDEWDSRVNRIVGLWATEGLVGPCSGTPVQPIRNTLLIHAGGTIVEMPRIAPNGIPNAAGIPGIYQRGQALGTWTYDRSTRRYFIHLRFDNYVDGVYHGYSTVDREMELSNRGAVASGPVRATRYFADGTVLNEVCGQATSTPL